jgi:hypothetical protein
MDRVERIFSRGAGQGAQTCYRRRDGGLMLAVEVTPGIIELGRLTLVPDRTALSTYEDTVGRARAAFRDDLAASGVDVALAILEAAIDAAFERLREALRGTPPDGGAS